MKTKLHCTHKLKSLARGNTFWKFSVFLKAGTHDKTLHGTSRAARTKHLSIPISYTTLSFYTGTVSSDHVARNISEVDPLYDFKVARGAVSRVPTLTVSLLACTRKICYERKICFLETSLSQAFG